MSDDTAFDLQDLVRRTRSVREFRHEPAAGVAFLVRFPSRFDAVALDTRHGSDRAALARATVEASVYGWEGVTVRHAFPESKTPDEVLPFAPATLALVLDEQVGWVIGLWDDIRRRMEERAARMEAALKNSASGSGMNADGPAAVH